ncbi:MAG: ATP-binding cassette domain-containing protein, partial [Verrucomicrobia bacterium]|nr:ATP-binding cassette domain-containing protein [Verrucomicrobiota bacterium]
MELFKFLQKESDVFDRRILVLGSLAGMLNLLIIFALTAAAAAAAVQSQSDLPELIRVMLALSLFWFSQIFLLRRMTLIVEKIVENVRLRIVAKIRDADLTSIEHIGRAPLYNVISTHAITVSRAAKGICSALASLALLVGASLIIIYLSPIAFVILIGAVALIFLMIKINWARISSILIEATRQDNKFVQGFGHLMDGFKELKTNSAKFRDFLGGHLKPLVTEAKDLRTKAGLLIVRRVLFFHCSVYIILAAFIFLLPVLSPAEAPKLAKLTIFVVFIFGPLNQAVGVYPLFNEAAASIKEIQRVEQQLDSIYERGLADPVATTVPVLSFDTLRCTALAFSYRDERGQPSFSLEPFDFELSTGELVFITGGNGSGKSTFLKVLVGLYPPASGTIAVDGMLIDRDNRQSYRNLFSAIFSDFHLFDRLYGIEEVDRVKLHSLLEMTDLAGKTSIVDHQITSLNLSSGQRKRLALVLSVLEDKPILLLDEWAAEQDPPFRRKFYREILPWLKQQQKTVVAVTHDDDHYEVA